MARWLMMIVVAVAAGMFSASVRAADNADRPNIVYIVADDLGYADVGFQGISKDVKTPNIDAIAAGGVRFTDGYVSCPVCAPTRAGLLTGRYQQRFGFEFNPGPGEAENFGLPLDQVTLAQALKDAGYATGMVGKWHLGFKPEMRPTKRGFDSFYGFLGGAHAYNKGGEGKAALWRNGDVVQSEGYLTDVFAREAAAFVDKHAAARAKGADGAKPFFLYFAFNAVHTPLEAPQKYLERFPNAEGKRKTMLAMLAALDDAVGGVTQSLEKHGQTKNTVVIFHTDNGGPTAGNGSLNTPFRGFKGGTYEGGIRVPFAMRWPAKFPAGKVYDRPVISLDMFPTVLAAAGGALPKDAKLDGVDLTPHLSGQDASAEKPPHAHLFWRFGAGKWAVRDGAFKLVQNEAQAAPQLYDLTKDPGEQKDLAGEMPDKVKGLKAAYDQWHAGNEQPRWRDSRDARRAGQGQPGAAGGTRRERRAARQAEAAKQPAGEAAKPAQAEE